MVSNIHGCFSKENLVFQRSHGGSTFSREFQLLPGGVQVLSPIETYRTCDFPRGSGSPVLPLDLHSRMELIWLKTSPPSCHISSNTRQAKKRVRRVYQSSGPDRGYKTFFLSTKFQQLIKTNMLKSKLRLFLLSNSQLLYLSC